MVAYVRKLLLIRSGQYIPQHVYWCSRFQRDARLQALRVDVSDEFLRASLRIAVARGFLGGS
jgi:hypothetical protein